MSSHTNPTVLVTGASSGLGRAAALHLAGAGYAVFAGVRSDTAAAELAAASPSITPLQLDVTVAADIAAAHATIAEAVGTQGLHGLVNNAGICISAPLECVTPEDLRYQLEVNVIGPAALTRALLPLLRTGGRGDGPRGRVVNVSSGLGRVASPFLGAYATSQFAKEGWSDSLRRELKDQRVSVSVIEPGAILTPIWDKVSDTAERILAAAAPEVAEVYRKPFTAFVALNDKRARASRTKPDQFAKAVEHAMSARGPRTRYQVGLDSAGGALAARLLPDKVLDIAIAQTLRVAN